MEYIPELTLCGTAVVLILLDIFNVKAIFVYVAIAGIILHLFFINDVFKVIMGGATIITLCISDRQQKVEYFFLILCILLGADILVSSSSFVMILLGMEMISLSSYVLTTGMHPAKERAEAGWKFFIYGSVATAIMVFGMTYLYGSNGRAYLSAISPLDKAAMLGGVMTLCGFLFKMTAAPFHLWAPDVYEAAPAPVIAYLSVVPKLAAFLLVAQWTAAMDVQHEIVIIAAAILSIITGTLAALNQRNAKRMMAYSSVAQAGFFLAILPTLSDPNVMVFYALVFAIMNYAVFMVIHFQEQSGKGTAFDDFSGIGRRNPLVAIAITLGLVSLTGLPPTAGFMAKLAVFTAIWTKYQDTNNSLFLALLVTGLLATVASLFFYLKIPFYAFFRHSEEKQPIKINLLSNLLLIILVALLLALFVAPGLVDGLHE